MATKAAFRPGERIPMSWEEYEALDHYTVRGEYIDGELIVAAFPTQTHQRIVHNLLFILRDALPDRVDVLTGWGWKPGDDEFGADLVVFDTTEEEKRLTAVPHLAVEVLSSDKAADTIRKHRKYAEVGLPRYWIIEADGPEVTVYRLEDGGFIESARHGPGVEATLDIGPATVTVDPARLLD